MRAITPEGLAPVTWAQVNVVTTELLAKLYGAAESQIRQNFNNNARRFVEGKHFYKLEGASLREFKNQVENNYAVPKRAAHLILWTERGAARHAKMLETDQAWEVFEKLEDHYFHRRPADVEGSASELSTVFDREPLLTAAASIVVHHHLPFGTVYQTLNHFAAAARFKGMTKQQARETVQFVTRFLLGTDTRQDWKRIEQNRKALAGPWHQPSLTGLLVPPWGSDLNGGAQ